MARYPLSKKIDEYTQVVSGMVGQQGWQGRLTGSWKHKREEFSDKALGSQKLYIVRFRTAIKEWFASLDDKDERKKFEGRVLSIITFPEGMTETLNSAYTKAVKSRAENLVMVPNAEQLVAVFVEWLGSDDLRQKALGVMGLTGRRFIEVVRDGKFAPVAKQIDKGRVRQKFVLEFGGQAKTRGAEGTLSGQTYRIPVVPNGKVDTTPMVIEAVKAIRESKLGKRWQEFDYQDLNSGESGRFNGQLRGALANVEGMTPELREKLSVKWLRALYAELAYARFGSIRRTKSVFFAQVLGHSEDDLKTSLSYMVLALGRDDSEIEQAKAEVQRLLDAVKLQANQERAARQAGEVDHDEDGVVIENDDMD
jgi:hypothetical protein